MPGIWSRRRSISRCPRWCGFAAGSSSAAVSFRRRPARCLRRIERGNSATAAIAVACLRVRGGVSENGVNPPWSLRVRRPCRTRFRKPIPDPAGRLHCCASGLRHAKSVEHLDEWLSAHWPGRRTAALRRRPEGQESARSGRLPTHTAWQFPRMSTDLGRRTVPGPA